MKKAESAENAKVSQNFALISLVCSSKEKREVISEKEEKKGEQKRANDADKDNVRLDFCEIKITF